MPCSRPPRARIAASLALASVAAVSGCAGFSRNRMDDCRLRVQSLQSENEQLRDVASNVRNENRDMAMRALDDSRRIRAQEEAIARLEGSIAAYQEEVTQMATLLDDIRGQVRSASGGLPPTALMERLRETERRHPSVHLDPATATLEFDANWLFADGRSRLTEQGAAWIASVGSIIRTYADEQPGEQYRLEVEIPAQSNVRAASARGADDPLNDKGVTTQRAALVRAELARTTGVDAARIQVTSQVEVEPTDGVIRAAADESRLASLRIVTTR